MPNNLARGRKAEPQIVEYKTAGPTIDRFHASDAFARAIMGPFGSGKSSACVMEIMRRAGEQAPAPDGKRYTRFAVIRNTYPELQTTTVATFKQWVRGVGKWNHNPPISYTLKTGDLDLEVIFLALDSEEDLKKLLSLELTGAWLNECRETPKALFDAVTARVGRFPAKSIGGPTWSGVILDTNPPADDHWFFRLFESERPEGFELFKQPSGLSQEAENIANLPNGRAYYERISIGKDDDWKVVYVEGRWGRLIEGKVVLHTFRDSTHVAPEPLQAVPDLPLLIGVDFGLTPAAVIAQRLVDGRWHILSEITTEDTGIVRFSRMLTAHVAQFYPDHDVAGIWADPAGNQRSQVDERTAIEVMAEHTGWKVRPAAPTNDWTMRLEACLAVFGRLIDGRPGIRISPACSALRKALNGGYHYKLTRKGGGMGYSEEPAKNFSSHVSDAFQYLLLGGGEANVVMNKVKRAKRRPSGDTGRNGTDYDVFDPAARGSRTSERGRQEYLKKIGFFEVDFNQ